MDVRGITLERNGIRDRGYSLWVEQDARGWTVTVCISNIAAAISKDSIYDKTAFRRLETRTLADGRSSPMLPRRFSEGSCSITPGQKRSVVAVRVRLDHELERQFLSIDESCLVSTAHLTFLDGSRVLESRKGEIYPVLDGLRRLSDSLAKHRSGVGWTEAPDLGNDSNIELSGIVREISILANSSIARFCVECKIPALYIKRVASPGRGALETYSAEPEDSIGNIPFYTHGILPIRRYADLVIQRQILAYINRRPFPYTPEDLQTIAQHINGALEDRARAAAQAELESLSRGSPGQKRGLEDRSDKEFERILKRSLRSSLDVERMSKALASRILSNRATITELYIALLKTDVAWETARRAALDHLSRKPYKAVSVTAMASRCDGWGKPEYRIERKGGGGRVIHEVQVKFEKADHAFGMARAAKLKLAKQRAMVEAIAKAIDETMADWPDDGEIAKGKLMPWQAENSVNAIAEYCQALGMGRPEYSTAKSGPDHAPIFIARCRALDFEVHSDPKSSKKAAKQQAAKKIINLVRARLKHSEECRNGNVKKL